MDSHAWTPDGWPRSSHPEYPAVPVTGGYYPLYDPHPGHVVGEVGVREKDRAARQGGKRPVRTPKDSGEEWEPGAAGPPQAAPSPEGDAPGRPASPPLAAWIVPGAQVTWRHRPRGGCGYALALPGWVVKIGPRRVQIEVKQASGERVRRWVAPASLQPAEDNQGQG